MSRKKKEAPSSFTKEQWDQINEYVKTASNSELVGLIYDALNLYPTPERENIEKTFKDFFFYMKKRYQLEEKYQKILACRDAWSEYRTSCELYLYACKVRHAYALFKAEQERAGGSASYDKFLDYESRKKDSVIVGYAEGTARRCLISETESSGIKRPEPPTAHYASLDEITATEISDKEVFSRMEEYNLKHLLGVLLQCLETEGNENAAPAIIKMALGKYMAYGSHKKDAGLFSAKIKTHEELKSASERLFSEIKSLQEECETISKSFPDSIS